MPNPYEYEYCDKHDVAYDDFCFECKADHDDFLYDCYKDIELERDRQLDR